MCSYNAGTRSPLRRLIEAVDDFGQIGRCWRETNVEATDLETVISDLMSGQYNDPRRVVGFNTFEGWSRDVSVDDAEEIARRCGQQGEDVPATLQDFVERHEVRADWRAPVRGCDGKRVGQQEIVEDNTSARQKRWKREFVC